ncbi:MAG TPA: tRNA pseudouridine(38-40) synthase TruA, partial [Mucilaginibacter sp.]
IEHTLCYVSSASLFIDTNGDKLKFQVTANRFLSKMIRIIVGRLLEIGRGEMPVDEFEHYLINKVTPKIIIPAYPQGLYLSKVTYPYLDIPPQTAFTSILENSMDNGWQEL